MAVALAGAGVERMTVVNRTLSRAEALAERVGGVAADAGALPEALAGADVLLTSTGAGAIIVDPELVEAAMVHRPSRPLLVVDVGVPRDVDPSVGKLPGVTLLDLDDLREWADRGVAERAAEASTVWTIVAEEVARHVDETSAREMAPLLAELHDRADAVRQAELDRFESRLSRLDESERRAVEAMTRRLVAKLLHDPSVRLKQDAGTARGERNAAAVRDLFNLA
jgi:glutamyl-tRNA reductase